MTKKDGIAEFVGDLVGMIIGWAICMAMLLGGYFLGYGLAHWLELTEHDSAFGILSGIAFVWMYEHQRANERWTRFFSQPKGH